MAQEPCDEWARRLDLDLHMLDRTGSDSTRLITRVRCTTAPRRTRLTNEGNGYPVCNRGSTPVIRYFVAEEIFAFAVAVVLRSLPSSLVGATVGYLSGLVRSH